MEQEKQEISGLDIAVIGMAGRFPGAKDIHQFWDNLKNGIESIHFFTDEELTESGVSPKLLANPNYVKANGILENCEYFDSSFFGYTPKEAEIMDPQIRVFHECAWAALEDAGYAPGSHDGLIGLYAGASPNFNWEALAIINGSGNEMGQFAASQLIKKDYLTLRVSYKLNLAGPSIILHTACSTSLVAIHLGCQAILNGECDIALAGGVAVINLNKTGYMYQEGMIASPDGHCRAFDAKAKGVVGGDAVALVVLKRLEDAVLDRDYIYAVVKGSAVNNDGIERLGFTAPSVEGQAKVIKMALQAADVEPESIGYIEAHGTATGLGDPIEMEGLTLAYNTPKKNFCGLGSLKTNVGHLDAAAGVAGFIKTVFTLKYKLIPPSLYYEIPNPSINFIDSPFYINSRLSVWQNDEYPLRAAVSSFGIGGTNAHVILERWEIQQNQVNITLTPKSSLLLLSAKTKTALEILKQNLATFLKQNPDINLADVAYTLQIGRKSFSHRWMSVCSNLDEAIYALTNSQEGEYNFIPTEEETSQSKKISIPKEVDKEGLTTIGKIWLQGNKIDWKLLYVNQKRYRIPLPTYPFEGIFFPVNGDIYKLGLQKLTPPKNAKQYDTSEISNWHYIPSWKSSILNPFGTPNKQEKINWLIFTNELNLCHVLVKQLRQKNHHVIEVKGGDSFSLPTNGSDQVYSINPEESSHYYELFKHLLSTGHFPTKIIHLWNITAGDEPQLTKELFNQTQKLGFFSLLYMAKAFGNLNINQDISITLLSNHVQEVNGGELLQPAKAPVLGLLKAIPQEYPAISTYSIDLELPVPMSLHEIDLIEILIEECTTNIMEPVVAYRNNQRWVQTFDNLNLSEDLEKKIKFKDQGVYLITGGLGKIGQIFCDLFTSHAAKVRLILTGRSPLPPKDEWEKLSDAEESSAQLLTKIKKIKQLEETGAQVLYIQANAADPVQMAMVVKQGEETFGKINGVIHTAGLVEGQSMRSIRELTDSDCYLQFEAKVYALLILNELFKDKNPDFYWVMSSISCVLAGLGFGAYASANLFMDVFVKQQNRLNKEKNAPHWFSINWDGMPEDWSLSLFTRMFALHGVDQVVASVGGNLEERIKRWIKLEPVRQAQNKTTTETSQKAKGYPRPQMTTAYVPPSTPTETVIVNIWKGLMGFNEIGINDDFLELGGDSLKAITVISRIYKELNVNIPVSEFFNRPTIAELARYIVDTENTGTEKYEALEFAEEKEYYPVSSTQKRLYILQQMDTKSIHYNLPNVVVLNDEYEKEHIKNIFTQLIARHESLRTAFFIIEGELVQKIFPHLECQIEYYTPPSSEEITRITSEFNRPFDLATPPLWRVGFINTKKGKSILLVDLHHTISDGVSNVLLIKEFNALNSGEKLPDLQYQYKDYSEWQNTDKQKKKRLQQQAYWLKEFAGEIPVLNLATDFVRPAERVFEGNRVVFTLAVEKLKALKTISKQSNVTLYMTLLAMFNVLFSKLSGQEDIVLGVVTAGRGIKEIQEIIGMFVNTLALRNFPTGEKSFPTFLQEVRERTLQSFENQDYMYEDLVELLAANKIRNRNPLFDVMFAYNTITISSDIPETETQGKEVFAYEYDVKQTKFDLSIVANEAGEHLSFIFEYAIKLFKEETIRRFVEYFTEIVEQIIENSQVKLKDIKIAHDLLKAESKRGQTDMENFNF